MSGFRELIAIERQRKAEGRCPRDGIIAGPSHLCPDLTPTKVSPRGSAYDIDPDDGISGVGFMDPRNRPDEPEPGAYLRPDEPH